MLSVREHRFPFLEKVADWNRFNRNTGGTLVEKCCHFFDLMRLVTRSDPLRVVEHLDLIQAVRSGRRPAVGPEDGLWSVATGVAAQRSIEEGRWVDLAEVLSEG